MWLFYHRLMLNTILRHSNILASFKSRDNAILNVFIQYRWWFKSEFKDLWIKLTKRFLALCFLLQILDYFFFQIKTMLSLGFKAEIQALSSISFNFLSETYLPVKIKHGRWIWYQLSLGLHCPPYLLTFKKAMTTPLWRNHSDKSNGFLNNN